ncbi:Beta- N-acetylglucosaminidase [Bacillus sp. OV166]|uniref:PA14 domain-containing protein n=1 Tax=Bacillus sp. OV166 TaxID=1882763 RepID=UPI000A2ADA68|nr:PA14 domain-containing protein [Bacillus sp. OV166]SMQ84321.1 Beta- N-acetylglucosaminidase [Bacillus sp. OV166]
MLIGLFSTTVDSTKADGGPWKATFYSKINFSGQVISKSYTNLNLNWGAKSPDTKIPTDNFSAVFERQVTVSTPGKYKLIGKADDGIRIYVDGKKRIDFWSDGVHSINNEIYLTAGTHTLRAQYYEKKWSAAIAVDLVKISETIGSDTWSAEFYPSADFSGNPVKKAYQNLNLYWAGGSPTSSIPSDHFTAVFKKQVKVAKSGNYRLAGKADDGVRVYVDGTKKVDKWKSGINPFSQDVYLTAGNHTILIEYLEDKYSSSFAFNIEEVVDTIPPEEVDTIPVDKWSARFYPSRDFTGTPIKKEYNELQFSWGGGSPDSKIPTDNFSGIFERNYVIDETGDYKIVGTADDGARVYVDGVRYVDKWTDGVNIIDAPITLKPGTHTVKVEYFDSKYSAKLNLKLEPTNHENEPIDPTRWKATYYPSKDFTGTPLIKVYDELQFSWGNGSPDPMLPTDGFSGTFEKQYVVTKPGKYRFIGKADDGVRVYVDGVLNVDKWKDGVNIIDDPVTLTTGTHTIKVEYYDSKYSATMKLDLIEDFWEAKFYPSNNLTGTPVQKTFDDLDFYWSGSPITNIPADNFSAVFEKKVYIAKSSNYKLSGKADDGIRIYVDGLRKMDSWKDGVNNYSSSPQQLPEGIHTIKVEYYDSKYSASLVVNLSEVIKKTTTQYTNYDISLGELLNKQIGVSQSDKKYDAYVRSDLLKVNASTPNVGVVNTENTNVRGIPVNGWILGKLDKDEKVTIYSKTKQSDGYYWYKIKYNETWVNPSPTDISYYINPTNFGIGTSSYYQFLMLSEMAGADAYEVNQKILTNKGILTGKGQVFVNAGALYNINEIYLISHALLETGNGSSPLAKGVKVKKKLDSNGNPVIDPATGEEEITELASDAASYDAIVYNMYGVGAFDKCPLHCGARKAFKEGWTTPDKAIVGGAEFVALNYIDKGQDTIYKMKWNPAAPGTNQYATDIGWAVKQTPNIFNLYSLLDSYTLVFDVPKY